MVISLSARRLFELAAKLGGQSGHSGRGRMIALDVRPRNGDGEFAPEMEGGPDAAAMAKAYGPAAIKGAGAAMDQGGASALLARKWRGRGPTLDLP